MGEGVDIAFSNAHDTQSGITPAMAPLGHGHCAGFADAGRAEDDSGSGSTNRKILSRPDLKIN